MVVDCKVADQLAIAANHGHKRSKPGSLPSVRRGRQVTKAAAEAMLDGYAKFLG
jgi:hypothetical protein